MASRAASILLLAAALSLGSAAAAARPLLLAGQTLTLSEAAAQVQRQTGGRVLGAETVRRDEQVYYEIRVLVKPGQVKVYRVDPDSGAGR